MPNQQKQYSETYLRFLQLVQSGSSVIRLLRGQRQQPQHLGDKGRVCGHGAHVRVQAPEHQQQCAAHQRRTKQRQATETAEGALLAKNEQKAMKKAIKKEIVKRSAVMRIVAAWIVTVPATAVLAAILFHLVSAVLA